jgi:hypothetical protein
MEKKPVDTRKIEWIALILIISVSAVLAYGYFNRIDRPKHEARLELHGEIVGGTAPSPYRYRVLVPLAGEGMTRALSFVLSAKHAFLLSYLIYDLLAIFLLLWTLFLWLRNWFSAEQALTGALFVAGTIPIALQDHYFQPWSILEVGLFTASLLAIRGKRHILLAVLVALATLNRETAVFIPVVYLLMTVDSVDSPRTGGGFDWKPVLRAGALLIVWAVLYFGIRLVQGSAPHTTTVADLFARNITAGGLSFAAVNVILFLGGFWIFAVLGFRHAPRIIRRIAWLIPLYLITILVWGVWKEVRLLMPLYPILVPMGLSFVFRRDIGTGE